MTQPAQFTYPPEAYAAETARSSRFWWLVLPVFVAVLLPVVAWFSPAIYTKWFVNEHTGVIEFMHTAMPLATAVIAALLLLRRSVRRDAFLVFWMAAIVAGSIYLSGEEASWGQHYVGWSTPEYWTGLNDQQETNLHNVSHWLDQKPRLLLTVGIIVTGLVFPFLHLRAPGILPRRFDITYPALALSVLAALVLVGEAMTHSKDLMQKDFEKALRPGEWQELFIVWFMLYYVLFIKWRLDRQSSGGSHA